MNKELKEFLKSSAPSSILKVMIILLKGARDISHASKVLFDASLIVRGLRFKRPLLTEIITKGHLIVNELWMAELISLLPLSGKVFVDAGVNIGQTLLSMKSVYPEAVYFGFEPNPVCVFYVEQLISKNTISNSNIIPTGLSDRNGIEALWVTEGNNTGSGSTMSDIKPRKGKRPQFVSVVRLDDVWASMGGAKLDLLKVDVEGYEPEVLYGAKETIKKCQPFMIIELLPLRMNEDRVRKTVRDSLQKIVEELGYQIFRISKSNRNSFDSLVALTAFPSDPVSEAESHCYRDYLLVPSQRILDIRELFSDKVIIK